MIDPNRVTEAVTEFMQNPTWKDIFVNAPGGAMERLAISFYFSKFHDQFKPEDFQEYRDLRDEYEKSMTEEDLNYLIENTDKPNAKKHYEELLAKLQEKGGQPEGQMRFEKSHEERSQDGEAQAPADEKAEATETEQTPNGEEQGAMAVEEKTQEQPQAEDDEKKKDLAEKDEKYDTALAVALEYLQNEQEAVESGTGRKEPSKMN